MNTAPILDPSLDAVSPPSLRLVRCSPDAPAPPEAAPLTCESYHADCLLQPLSPERQLMVICTKPIVRRVASRHLRRCGRVFTKKDLVAIGFVALVEAASLYVPGPRSFALFAEERVDHAMRAAIRRERPGWLRVRDVQRASLEYQQRFEATRTDNAADARRQLDEYTTGICVSMFTALISGVLMSPEAMHAEAQIFRRASAALRPALERLNPRDRQLIELRYTEELEMPEVAKRLGLSEATAWRRHRSALKVLGTALKSASKASSKRNRSANLVAIP